jgi:hypothetical protein
MIHLYESLWEEDTPGLFRYLATGHNWVIVEVATGKAGGRGGREVVDGREEKARTKVSVNGANGKRKQ